MCRNVGWGCYKDVCLLFAGLKNVNGMAIMNTPWHGGLVYEDFFIEISVIYMFYYDYVNIDVMYDGKRNLIIL